jgi:hypothetical protein
MNPSSSRILRLSRFAATFTLALAAVLALGLLWPASTLRAEGRPKLSVEATNARTGDGIAPGVFTFTLSEPSKTAVYSLKGTAVNGVDYVRLSGVKKIKAGKTTATVQVVFNKVTDAYFSPETIKLLILPHAGYVVGLPKRATVTLEFVLP